MPRLPHHCLIAVCLAGSLLLLPHYCAEVEYDYDSTPSPDYDYNATFDYNLYSNGSTEELEDILRKHNEDSDRDLEATVTTIFVSSQASRTVYPSLLLILTAHQMLRFL